MGKRVFLFLLTNLFVVITISLAVNVLGLNTYLENNGINYSVLAGFCLMWGMSGSFIALLFSKFIAKLAMRIVMINPLHATPNEQSLLNLVCVLGKKAGLHKTPAVGVYRSSEMNAFATGFSKHHALIAVSTGLLSRMNQDELEAVLSHEISHIANGDMVTMTLLQGVVNAFSLFLSRITAYAISIAFSKDQDETISTSHLSYLLTLIFDIAFTLLGSLLTAYYSRWREFRADRDGAKLVGAPKMISALKRLQHLDHMTEHHLSAMTALMIASQSHWFNLFSTHPSLEKRIERLQSL